MRLELLFDALALGAYKLLDVGAVDSRLNQCLQNVIHVQDTLGHCPRLWIALNGGEHGVVVGWQHLGIQCLPNEPPNDGHGHAFVVQVGNDREGVKCDTFGQGCSPAHQAVVITQAEGAVVREQETHAFAVCRNCRLQHIVGFGINRIGAWGLRQLGERRRGNYASQHGDHGSAIHWESWV